jgi:hypothetical protein
MILKIMCKNGQSNYKSAEEFTIHKVVVKGIYDKFKSEYDKSNIMYFNDKHNFMVRKIHELTGMDNQIIDFIIDCEFEDLDLICCVYPRSKGKEHNIIATNQMAFLMSDEGKTIERLI